MPPSLQIVKDEVISEENKNSIDSDSDDSEDESSKDHLSSFREMNPNLQPLTPTEEKELSFKLNTPIVEEQEPTPPPLPERSPKKSTINELKSRFNTFTKPKISNNALNSTDQKFWKYHILELGDNYFYLTTNPDSKHLYCRNAPGVYVEIISDSITDGFKLRLIDPLDEKVFMMITSQKVNNKLELNCQSMRRFYKDEDGNIIRTDDNEFQLNLIAKEKKIQWTKDSLLNSETEVKPIKFELNKFNIGSITQFKSSSKLKNKRFIYFTNQDNKIYALFRPHELRIKKKLITKLNRLSINTDNIKYRYVNKDDTNLEALSNEDDVYYTADDGINQKNPIDDSPNDIKLGWMSVIDDDMFKIPGNWEMVIGFSLAVSLIKVFEDK